MDEYQKQAAKFLEVTNSTIKIELADPQIEAPWEDDAKHKRYQYEVTLTSPRGSYTFSFWDSIHNAEKMDALKLLASYTLGNITAEMYRAKDLLKNEFNKTITPMRARREFDTLSRELYPGAYSVLACLDLVYSNNFEDFCAEYGYDTDSRTAEKVYKECIEQDRQLRRLYTHEELELLQEIA